MPVGAVQRGDQFLHRGVGQAQHGDVGGAVERGGVGGELRPGIVHRLDKGTSGVMVVAKNDDAHKELARQFHDREVEKEYVALAWGLVQQRKRINAAIGRTSVIL